MNPAEVSTCLLIERTLAQSPAFRQIDPRLYIVKQGSCFVMINVLPWGGDRAVVRCVAQLVKGVNLAPQLASTAFMLDSYHDRRRPRSRNLRFT